MANIKDLKKDINFLLEEVIETCFLHYQLNDDKSKKEEIDQIIDDIIVTRNDLIHKVNNPDKELKGSARKKYFTELLNEMTGKADEAFEKLGGFEKK